MKQVDEKKLARELQDNNLRRGFLDVIEAHNPAKENIVRPWDVVKRGRPATGHSYNKGIVTTEKNYNYPNDPRRFVPVVWLCNGEVGSIYLSGAVTLDGKPVTGYEDD